MSSDGNLESSNMICISFTSIHPWIAFIFLVREVPSLTDKNTGGCGKIDLAREITPDRFSRPQSTWFLTGRVAGLSDEFPATCLTAFFFRKPQSNDGFIVLRHL